jgi:uracil-DNA glycosylase family 4
MDIDPTPPSTAALARELLDLYRALGVVDATADAPIDWLARGDMAPGSGFRLDAGGAGGSRPASAGSGPITAGAADQQRSPATVAPAPSPPAGASSAEPRSRTRPDVVPRSQSAPPAPASSPASRQFPTASPDAAVTAARAAAGQAQSLSELRAQLETFNGCGLKATAKSLCFYRGIEKARLMLIGEAPGRDEDLSGVPFVGPAGQLLDKMLAAIGLSDKDVHITNSVYWRPPGNRTPSPQETQACRPFLDRQIELVAPEIILLLGGAAANTVLGVPGGIMRLRGSWKQIDSAGRVIRVMPTLHPAYLLRSPAAKRQAWRDLIAVAEALGL